MHSCCLDALRCGDIRHAAEEDDADIASSPSDHTCRGKLLTAVVNVWCKNRLKPGARTLVYPRSGNAASDDQPKGPFSPAGRTSVFAEVAGRRGKCYVSEHPQPDPANGTGRADSHREGTPNIGDAFEAIYPGCATFRLKPWATPQRSFRRVFKRLQAPLAPHRRTAQHAYLIPAIAIMESTKAWYLFTEYCQWTVGDMMRLNPGFLRDESPSAEMQRAWIAWQLCTAVDRLHKRGIVHGSLGKDTVFLDETFWVRLGSFELFPRTHVATGRRGSGGAISNPHGPYSSVPKGVEEVGYTTKWARGDISTYQYLAVLNDVVGRRQGDPNFQPIFPWITDFLGDSVDDVSHCRDFSKTKFRLNKGDEQLDESFQGPEAYHITDLLSDITYYVYHARRTPVNVLRKFVRSKYEPNEYPASMARLYEWTPDECIPEFYSDASILRSVHDDMTDLDLPKWASSPEDFIQKHSAALESDYVSKRLHMWIDLIFGYKLTGREAIDAKNVALPLVKKRPSFVKHGIVQLFTEPHPKRARMPEGSPNEAKNITHARSVSFEPNFAADVRGDKADCNSDQGQAVHNANSVDIRDSLVSGATKSESSRIEASRHAEASSVLGVGNSCAPVDPSPECASDSASPAAGRLSRPDAPKRIITSTPPAESASAISHTVSASTPEDRVVKLRERKGSITNDIEFPSKIFTLESRRTASYSGVSSDATWSPLRRSPSGQRLASPVVRQQIHSKHRSQEALHSHVKGLSSLWNRKRIELPCGSFTDEFDCLEQCSFFDAKLASGFSRGLVWPASPRSVSTSRDNHVTSDDDGSDGKDFGRAYDDDGGTSFEEAKSKDLFALGRLLKTLFSAKNVSGGANGPCLKKPSAVELLRSARWQDRPSADLLLSHYHWNLPFTDHSSIHHQVSLSKSSPISIPACVPNLYAFVSQLRTSSPEQRQNLAKSWIPGIRSLEDEAVELVLSSLISLFMNPETRSEAFAYLVEPLGNRIGTAAMTKHLVKPLLSYFENEQFPMTLLDQAVISQIVKQFGFQAFLQHVLPRYLDILASTSYSNRQTLSRRLLQRPNSNAFDLVARKTRSFPDVASYIAKHYEGAASSGTQTVEAEPTMGRVAKAVVDALRHICRLLGPVLASKHVVRPVIRLAYRDSFCMDLLQETLATIGGLFGETLAAIEFSGLVTCAKSAARETTAKSCNILCSLVSLLEALTIRVSPADIVQELKSGFGDTLYKLLELPGKVNMGSSDAKEEVARASVGLRAIDYLLCVSYIIGRPEWEKHIVPILQKYFSGFRASFEDLRFDSDEEAGVLDDTRKNHQMIYAYSQFCLFIGQETMRRFIPTSDAIERIMYEYFENPGNVPITTPKFSALVRKAFLRSREDLPRRSPSSTSPSGPGRNPKLSRSVSHSSFRTAQERAKHIAPVPRSAQEDVQFPNGIVRALRFVRKKGMAAGKQSQIVTLADQQSGGSDLKPEVPSEFIANWKKLLGANPDEMARPEVFSFKDWKLGTYSGHTAAVRCIATDEETRQFVTASRDRTCKVWSLDHMHQRTEPMDKEPERDFVQSYDKHRSLVTHVCFAGVGRQWAASGDGAIHLWDLETASTIREYGATREGVTFTSMTPAFKSRQLVLGTSDGAITFLDTVSQMLLHTWDITPSYLTPLGAASLPHGGTKSIAVCSGTESLLAASVSGGRVSLLEARTGGVVRNWKAAEGEVTAMRFYKSDMLVTCASTEHAVRVWDVNSGECLKTVRVGHDVVALDIEQDNLVLLTANNSVSFISFNDAYHSYSSKFDQNAVKCPLTCFGTFSVNQLLVFGTAEGKVHAFV